MSPRRERKPQPIPALTKPRKQRLPSVAERTLASGLRVVAVRRASVPLVHLRLRVPNAIRRDADLAKAAVLSRTMMLGTSSRSQGELAEALQRLGGGLRVDDGADGLSFGGESLKSELGSLLGLLAEVLTDAAYPRAASEREAGRLGDHLRRALSQPGVVADEAWLNRRYGDHPYGRSLPTPDEVAEVAPRSLRALHRRRVVPRGSLLVLVGDLTPARALDQVEKALGGWQADGTGAEVPTVPDVPHEPLLLVDRPGAVQSNLRVGGFALPRTDPDHAAQELANAIFQFGEERFSRRIAREIVRARKSARIETTRALADIIESVFFLSINWPWNISRISPRPTPLPLWPANICTGMSMRPATPRSAMRPSRKTKLLVKFLTNVVGLDVSALAYHSSILSSTGRLMRLGFSLMSFSALLSSR